MQGLSFTWPYNYRNSRTQEVFRDGHELHLDTSVL